MIEIFALILMLFAITLYSYDSGYKDGKHAEKFKGYYSKSDWSDWNKK